MGPVFSPIRQERKRPQMVIQFGPVHLNRLFNLKPFRLLEISAVFYDGLRQSRPGRPMIAVLHDISSILLVRESVPQALPEPRVAPFQISIQGQVTLRCFKD